MSTQRNKALIIGMKCAIFIIGVSLPLDVVNARVLFCNHGEFGNIVVNTDTHLWKQSDGTLVRMRPRQTTGLYDLQLKAEDMVVLLRGRSSILVKKKVETDEMMIIDLTCSTSDE